MSDEAAENPKDEASAETPEEQDAAQDTEQDTKADKDESQSGEPSDETKIVNFQGKVEIHTDVPLPQYDVNRNKAFKAVAKDKGNTGLFAIVCERHLVPRIEDAKKYSKIINPNMATLVLHGPVYWPPAGQERYVFIYLDNLGQPILDQQGPAALGWKQDDVMKIIVKPMVNVLQDFADKDFVHGGIRPNNMFDARASGMPKKVILGDCLSTPASYVQPSLYEPIERAMADPIARGEGTLADDLYAFGISLAVCLRSNDPLAGKSEDEVIRKKIIHGSYAAVTGKDRFKGEILELLRGLLHDDPSQRWTIDEVLTWMDGRRLSPKQALIRKKASRPLAFSGEKYMLAQTLAMDVGTNPTETKRIIEDDSLMQWVQRSLEDVDTMEKVEAAVANAQKSGTGPGYEARLVSQLSAALDTVAPLRFKNMCFTGDGMGTALAEAIVLKQDVRVFSEILTSGIMLDWIASQTNPNLDITALFSRYELCKRVVKVPKSGDGLERCLYILSPEAPCLSETLDRYFISGPERMLIAFEDMCRRKKAQSMFLDRHCVAYLMQRDPKVIEPYIFEINVGEEHKTALANLKCLADIQRLYKVDDLPHLTEYFATCLASVYERYHDRNVRDKIKDRIEEIADGGDLGKMVAVLDNIDLINKDAKAYRKALEEFSGLQQEKEELAQKIEDKDTFGVETGQEVAAIAASVLAVLIIVGAAMMFFSN